MGRFHKLLILNNMLKNEGEHKLRSVWQLPGHFRRPESRITELLLYSSHYIVVLFFNMAEEME